MSEVSRRAMLGGLVGGAMAGALPAAPAAAGHHGGWLDNEMSSNRDWAEFLAGADLVWKRLPTTWYEGPFLGNGFLGSGIYAEPGRNAVRFNVQHSQVQDHRPEFGSLFGLARLPIGYLTLEPVGRDHRHRLAPGPVERRTARHHHHRRGQPAPAGASSTAPGRVLAVEVTPTEGERGFRWMFHPAEAISPRADPKFNRPAAGRVHRQPAAGAGAAGDVEARRCSRCWPAAST